MLKHKYRDIAETLAGEIASGKYRMYSRFASEHQLMARFKVARGTIREVLAELVRCGYLNHRHGSGNYVRQRFPDVKRPKIGMIVTGGLYAERFQLLADEVIRLAGEEGFELMLEDASRGGFQGQRAGVAAAVERMLKEDVSGIMYQPLPVLHSHDRFNHKVTDRLAESGVPVVLFDGDVRYRRGSRSFDMVDTDPYEAGQLLSVHLQRQGCLRMLFLSGMPMSDRAQTRLSGIKSIIGKGFVSIMKSSRPRSQKLQGRIRRSGKIDAIICQDYRQAEYLFEVFATDENAASVPVIAAFDGYNGENSRYSSIAMLECPYMNIISTAFYRLLHRLRQPTIHPCAIYLSSGMRIGCRMQPDVRQNFRKRTLLTGREGK